MAEQERACIPLAGRSKAGPLPRGTGRGPVSDGGAGQTPATDWIQER